MKKFWKFAGIATLVAILGAVTVGAVAFAQEGEDGSDWPFNFREKMHEAIADVLGISIEEYDTAIETAHEQVLADAVTEGWLTEGQAEQMRERAAERGEEGFGPGRRPGMPAGKFGPGKRGDLLNRGARSFIPQVAEAFDMTVRDLLAELKDGKSVAALAEEKNVDLQPIIDAHLEQIKEHLDQAVADGKLTQERADWMLDQAESKITDMLEKSWEGLGPGGRPGGRPGGFQGFPGKPDA